MQKKAKLVRMIKGDISNYDLYSILDEREVGKTLSSLSKLRTKDWAKPLVEAVDRVGLKSLEHRGLYFEVRLAAELDESPFIEGIKYEHKTGHGKKSVDFALTDNQGKQWYMELTHFDVSDAVKKQTFTFGNYTVYSSRITPGDTSNNAEIRDLIKTQRKILEKAEKFPVIQGQNVPYHIIIINMAGFSAFGGDEEDYKLACYGNKCFSSGSDLQRDYINNGEKNPILGVFASDHPDEKSKYVRENIHAIGFIREKWSEPIEILEKFVLMGNPEFFKTTGEIAQSVPFTKKENIHLLE